MIVKHLCISCSEEIVRVDSYEIVPYDEYWWCTKCLCTKPPTKRARMRNKPCYFDHRYWPSLVEARRMRCLLNESRHGFGDVESVIAHPTFFLPSKAHSYKADSLVRKGGDTHAEDVKGQIKKRDSGFARTRKAWLDHGPCPLHIVVAKGAGWHVHEIIPGGGQE